jgi:predicted PurR-regulated permease PerM
MGSQVLSESVPFRTVVGDARDVTEEVVTDVTNKLHEQNELNVRAIETSTSRVMPYLEASITFVSFVAVMIGALAAAVLVSPVVLVYLCARGFDMAKQMIDKRFERKSKGGKNDNS